MISIWEFILGWRTLVSRSHTLLLASKRVWLRETWSTHACNAAPQNRGGPVLVILLEVLKASVANKQCTELKSQPCTTRRTLRKKLSSKMKSYPADCPGNMKRIIRRKALKFQVTENVDLYYKHNQKGQVRTQYMYSNYACTYYIHVLMKNLPTRHAVYCRSICSMMYDNFLIL